MAMKRPGDDAHGDVDALVVRAAAARARAGARAAAARADLAVPDQDRLDDRTRAAVNGRLAASVAAVEDALRIAAAQRLAAAGEARLADALLTATVSVLDPLRSSLLQDDDFSEELVDTVRLDLIGRTIAPAPMAEAERPSLLVRLAECPDTDVAPAAAALLAADNGGWGQTTPVALPAHLYHRLVWRVAAALRDGVADEGPTIDAALVDAAHALLAGHDEGARSDAAAMRLAIAIDARRDELPELLIEALGDRRPQLFVALLAQAARLDYADMRTLVLDPDGAQLGLVLRAHGIDRATIARIGLALCEGDPRRDVERFADDLDAIMAVDRDHAAAAIAPLTLPADYRQARRAIGTAARR